MNVWWCDEHRTQGDWAGCLLGAVGESGSTWLGVACEMEQRRLVPVDALVLVRDADGLWPQWAVNVFDVHVDGEYDPFAFFDALAEAAKDNPQ